MNPDRRQAFRLLAGSRRSDFSQSGDAAVQHEGPLTTDTVEKLGFAAVTKIHEEFRLILCASDSAG
jgi:hypothetical protein